MSILTSYSRLSNSFGSQEIFQRKKKFKTVKDWSFGMQCSGNKYDGVSIPARKHSITVVALNEGIFFYFNVTYFEQTQKVCNLFSETVNKYTENSNSIKLWKLLPYEELYLGSSGLIDAWIVNAFPKANVENKKLEKGYCLLIDRGGNEELEYKSESLYKKTARSIKKGYSIFSCKEDKFRVS
ncbi:MAG TPA: hypothetical protein VGZ69_00965 [Candidatus Rhabdochlamydia sp.]|nr:hypothetical protein [Candidatus Rhabdochlamydia sp.]